MSKISKLNTNIGLNLLNKSLYNKSFIRGRLQNRKRIIDFNENIDYLIRAKRRRITKKRYSKRRSSRIGVSIRTKEFVYKSSKIKHLQFKKHMDLVSVKQNKILNSFLKVLCCLTDFTLTSKGSQATILVIRPKKSGFLCLANGIIGLLCRKHFNFIFRDFPIFFPLNSRYILKFLPQLLNSKLLLRFPVRNLTIDIFPPLKRKKRKKIFNKKHRPKKRKGSVDILFYINKEEFMPKTKKLFLPQ